MFNHDEGITTSTRAREADVGNGGGLPFKQNERPESDVLPELVKSSEDLKSFDRMEQRLRSLNSSNLSLDEQVLTEVGGKPPRILDGTARVRIERGVIRAGLTLSHLEYLFPWHALTNSTSPIGLLIRYAEDFENRSQGVEWPRSRALCVKVTALLDKAASWKPSASPRSVSSGQFGPTESIVSDARSKTVGLAIRSDRVYRPERRARLLLGRTKSLARADATRTLNFALRAGELIPLPDAVRVINHHVPINRKQPGVAPVRAKRSARGNGRRSPAQF